MEKCISPRRFSEHLKWANVMPWEISAEYTFGLHWVWRGFSRSFSFADHFNEIEFHWTTSRIAQNKSWCQLLLLCTPSLPAAKTFDCRRSAIFYCDTNVPTPTNEQNDRDKLSYDFCSFLIYPILSPVSLFSKTKCVCVSLCVSMHAWVCVCVDVCALL